MNELNRRLLLGIGGATVALAATGGPATATTRNDPQPLGPVMVRPGDPRYEDLAVRGINTRFEPRPEAFYTVGSTEQVVGVVGDAVRAGRRITVRSGGHCLENFVGEAPEGVVIDLSELKEVYFDPRLRAFVIEPGATLLEAYQKLYFGWNVTIPGGICGTVGAGGHIQGGGYGPFSRLFGSTVDHLYAVEVVVVDGSGNARAVVATREPTDPNRDLWWAHTGGGGGNFGVVTKYWMRTAGVNGGDPGRLLPQPPAKVTNGYLSWSWADHTADSFRRLIRNYCTWLEHNSAPDSANLSLFGTLIAPNKGGQDDPGTIYLTAQLDGTLADAEQQLRNYFGAMTDGVTARSTLGPITTKPWFQSTWQSAQSQVNDGGRLKEKMGYLRRGYTDGQLDTLYRYLTAGPQDGTAGIELVSYGGRVNAVAPDATALPQRDCILKASYLAGWSDPGKDSETIDWLRRFYRDMYADTGGVPVPGAVSNGCYINYPDIDIADPAWNTSGLAWHTLYYQGNYPRLQRVKARWDPRDIFHHALSIQKP